MDDKIKPASGQAVSSTPNKAEPAKDKNSNEQRKGSKLGGFFKKLGGALTGGEKNKNVMKP
jgi:hypothetical protein